MAWHFWHSSHIPFTKKFRYLWNQLEGVYSWATAPLIIFILGRLPMQLADENVKTTLLAHNAPIALKWLMTCAMVGLLFSAVLSTVLLPPRPKEHHCLKYGIMLLQWILSPFCMIIFRPLPATDAQTRLMLGKYLGFWVTEKRRTETPVTASVTS